MTAWADVVGAAHVARGGPADAVDGVIPAWVVRPGTIAEVQACLRVVAETRVAVVACGLGAHLDVGAPPRRLDVLLRLERLVRVVDHQAADMTVTVEAGCPLPTLAATLAAAGQWLPLDPPRPEATTVGGVIAANLGGPLRASQGRVRDLLIGIRVVEAGGALVASGGRVVKNVAGYDLPKLHVGALGTVGVIVEATFKVRPRPACEAAVLVSGTDVVKLAETALEIRDATVAPLWLDLAGPGVLVRPAVLAVGLGGLTEEVAAARAAVEAIARAHGLETDGVTDGAGVRARLTDFATRGAAATLRAAVLPADVGRVVEHWLAVARVPIAAHVPSGVVRAAVDDGATVLALLAELRPAVEANGGTLVVERARADVKTSLDPWGDPGPALPLMRRLKDAFDPGGVLAPGRFVGGL